MAGYRYVYLYDLLFLLWYISTQSIDHCVRHLRKGWPLCIGCRIKREDLGVLTNRNIFFSSVWMDHTTCLLIRVMERRVQLLNSIILVLQIFFFFNIVLYKCIKSCRLLLGQIVRYWRWLLMRVAGVLCVIIHESDFKSVACLYLMAASATHELLLELTSSKENDDPLVDRWSGKWLSLIFERHKEILNHDSSTSLFVECMLVMLMLEPLCKICL